MEITEVTKTKRVAPALVIRPRATHEFLQKAAVYNAVYDRIIELGQEFDVYFDVIVGNEVVEVYSGYSFADTTYHNKKEPVEGANNYIPNAARRIAEAVVVRLYGKL